MHSLPIKLYYTFAPTKCRRTKPELEFMGCLAFSREIRKLREEINKFKLELNKIKIILSSFMGTITSAIMSLIKPLKYSLVLRTL